MNATSEVSTSNGTVPNSLAVYRFSAGLTQQSLADRCSMSRVAIANLEAGKSEPRLRTARRISRALGVSVDDLFPEVTEK